MWPLHSKGELVKKQLWGDCTRKLQTQLSMLRAQAGELFIRKDPWRYLLAMLFSHPIK